LSDTNQDSFELFADTLTITLACIIFIALLLVTITRSHQIDQSGLFHLQRRSELLDRQIELAKVALTEAETALQSAIADDRTASGRIAANERANLHKIQSFSGQNEASYAKALLMENKRANLFLIKQPWISQTIEQNKKSLDDRIERAFADSANEAIALSVLREESVSDVEPVYWVVHKNRFYPVTGGPGKIYPHVAWTQLDRNNDDTEERIWQLSVKPSGGFGLEEALRNIETAIERGFKESNRQFVLLVYNDSFAKARDLLRHLNRLDVHFSWQPFSEDQVIRMSESGLPPDTRF